MSKHGRPFTQSLSLKFCHRTISATTTLRSNIMAPHPSPIANGPASKPAQLGARSFLKLPSELRNRVYRLLVVRSMPFRGCSSYDWNPDTYIEAHKLKCVGMFLSYRTVYHENRFFILHQQQVPDHTQLRLRVVRSARRLLRLSRRCRLASGPAPSSSDCRRHAYSRQASQRHQLGFEARSMQRSHRLHLLRSTHMAEGFGG